LKLHRKGAVITLLQNGVSQHEISRKTGVDRKTIRKIAQAIKAEINTDPAKSPTPTTGSADVLQNPPSRPPGISPGTEYTPSPSACEPFRKWIEKQVRLGRNATAIYQELVDSYGFEHGYNSVKRFCRRLGISEPAPFDRLEFLPGEEAQVDYGEGALTRYGAERRYRRPRLFVMTLRYSRRSFRKVVWKSSTEVWARLHEEAFQYFGGSCRYCVLDNLKEGVITPDIYEPELNRLYADMLAHYGVVADPARVRDPNRKGAVENAIQHTQDTALKGKRFELLEEQNDHLMHWEEKWAAQRIHGRAKRQVEQMFQEERPTLQPLPLQRFRYYEEGTRTVGDDTTIQVKGAWYAARPARIGSRVLIRLYEHELEIRNLETLELIRRHSLATHKGEVKLPDAERVFNPSRQTQQILNKAKAIGPHTQALCQALFDQRGREAQKSMWGIIGLAGRYPNCILEQAASIALAHGIRSYKRVRALAEQSLRQATALIEAGQAELPFTPPATPTLTQQHDLIRNTHEYAAFFQRSTQPQQNTGDLE
jgi:transposase